MERPVPSGRHPAQNRTGYGYAMAGNKDQKDLSYLAWTPAAGWHTLKATPDSKDKAQGETGAALSIRFLVVDRMKGR